MCMKLPHRRAVREFAESLVQKPGQEREKEKRSEKSEHGMEAVEHDVHDDHNSKRNVTDILYGSEDCRPDMRYCIHI